MTDEPDFEIPRRRMVRDQIESRGIDNPRILRAMSTVPRHEFVPPRSIAHAYEDRPLPIGYEQTISQPYIVALIAAMADPRAESRVLDIGTGCGYQAAVLSYLCQRVYSIEVIKTLAAVAQQRFDRLGLDNITGRHGDGYQGWPEQAPFDAIVVAAAPPEIPPALIEQLAPGGRLVIPIGVETQYLLLVEKLPDGSTRTLGRTPVSFVPMVHADET